MNEETLFDLILKTPESERAALLNRACEGKPELRQRVEALLKADEAPAQFLAQPPPMDATTGFQGTVNYSATETPGTVIAGKYKLLQQIGEGGMGSVWMADQTEPVKRRVAVKLIRTERGSSKTILARFEAERQAIALMDHPNIAKLLDAGTTENSSPYFVMELVKGVPLTEFCDQHKLSIPDRLSLFMQICSAVQHAHQKGIIHRDLKPSNILVELHDDKPVPKVIDFGLAKATSGMQLTENTLFTGFGTVAGTPLYMAPEQANFNAVDIDTRADVYALGVILYELLTGTTPITRETIKKAALDEMMKLIREQEAPTPSSRLSTSEMKPAVAANRDMEPLKLGRYIKGELDWIVMKALSKERDRRYETANGFARDIERFLNHEAVTAGPVSAGYRLKKFVTRNKGKVIAAGLVAVALLLGIIGTTLGLIAAKKQEHAAIKAKEAEAERAEGERLAKLDAQAKEHLAVAAAEKECLATELTAARLKQIETINNSVFDIFTEFDIRKVKEGTDPVEYVLAKKLIAVGKKLDEKAIQDPLVLTNLRDRLGQTLLSLGEAPAAIELFTYAVETRKARLGADHPGTLASMNNLAAGYQAAGKLDRALPLHEETLQLRKVKLGTDHPDTLTSMANLAEGYRAAGQLEKALQLLEETLKLMKARLGADHPDTLSSMGSLALGYQAAGKLDRALPLFEETLKLTKANQGGDHPDTLSSMNNLASGYQAAGKLDLALPLLDETLKLMKARLGADHPDTLISMNNLAAGYQDAGKLDRALPLYEETLNLRKAKLGVDHPDTLITMNNLAAGYKDAGQLEKAVPLFEETLKLMKVKLGADHPHTLNTMSGLAASFWSLKRLDLSISLFEDLLPRQEKKLGREHPNTQLTIANLGMNYKDAGRLKEALPLLEEAYRASKKHPTLRGVEQELLDAYAKAGATDQYTGLVKDQLADARKLLPKDSPPLAGQLAVFGLGLLEMKQWTQAEPLLREALAIREKKEPDAWTTFNTQSMLGGALLGQKKYADGEPLLVKGFEGMLSRLPEDPPGADATRLAQKKTLRAAMQIRIADALDRLIQLYTETNKPDEVKKWQAEKEKLPKLPEKK